MACKTKYYDVDPCKAGLSIVPTKELEELRAKAADYENLYDLYMDLYKDFDTMRLRAENLEGRLHEIAEVLDQC